MILAGTTFAMSQTIRFGFSDSALESSLNGMNSVALYDLPGFYAEINLQWGIPVRQLQAVSYRVSPAELYLVAFVASVSGKPIDVILLSYSKHTYRGWGEFAKEYGIKPGSKEFRTFKSKVEASKRKFKAKKR